MVPGFLDDGRKGVLDWLNQGPVVRLTYCSAGDPREGAPHPYMAACWLRARGYDVHLLCAATSAPVDSVLHTPLADIPVQFCRSGPSFQLDLLRNLLRARRRSSDDTVFYVHGHNATPAAWLALQGVSKQRVIYHTQDYLEPGRHCHWEFFEGRLARRAGWVISNEPNRARFLASHYGLREMPTVVRTALPRDWPRPAREERLRKSILSRIGLANDSSFRLIMHEGGYAKVRCGQQLIEALARLPKGFILVFTGMERRDPRMAELEGLVRNHNLQQRVVVLERMSFEDLLRHTAACDLGILLYPNDGVGNYYQCPGRLTHYIGCGLPMVASNFPGLELLNLQHRLGTVCDPDSPEEIAEAIVQIGGQSPPQLALEARRLRALAEGALSYETQAGKIEEIARQAAASLKSLPSAK
jgi:glycosyltransferase involved in cell wall biosynthesis